MEDPKQPMFRLDRETLVPLGLLVAVVLSAISATVWINTALLNLAHKVGDIDTKLATVATRLDAIQSGWWTQADMRAWVKLARAQNGSAPVVWPEAEPVLK